MIEILQLNYWEHFKAEKDLALSLPPDDVKRVNIQKAMAEILYKIEQLKK